MAANDSSPVRIFAWVVPRTISTALSKCLSNIGGMEIWFELFTYAQVVRQEYENKTGNQMPMEYEGNEDTAREAAELFMARLQGSRLVPERVVFGNLMKEFQASNSKYIFAKEGYLAFPDKRSRQYIPPGFKHVFLIRDPVAVFTSYRKNSYRELTRTGVRTGDPKDEEAFDIEYDDTILNAGEFFSGTAECFRYVRENLDPNPIVINSDDLLANPAEVLKKFCHLTGLPYSDSLLQWDASKDVTKTWKTAGNESILNHIFYETAVTSGRFLPPKTAIPSDKLPPDVRRLAHQSMPYFEEMNKYKI
nr:uncharacterized protein LOC129279275 [Lytechinus pictus]